MNINVYGKDVFTSLRDLLFSVKFLFASELVSRKCLMVAILNLARIAETVALFRNPNNITK